MKTRLIWRESWMNNKKDSFWVECTDQEVVDNILPLKSDADFMKEINFNREPSKINKNLNEAIYTNFFLVSVDLKNILSFNWVYPYAGMWNAANPFEEIEVADFDRLEQLKKMFKEIELKKLQK
ncbi:MAG TPA: hypothetical protein VFC69_00880 [Dysgonamonadaceae bacterium]|nr:hypothetical protein [Dysgonamonadaceae bacterium]